MFVALIFVDCLLVIVRVAFGFVIVTLFPLAMVPIECALVIAVYVTHCILPLVGAFGRGRGGVENMRINSAAIFFDVPRRTSSANAAMPDGASSITARTLDWYSTVATWLLLVLSSIHSIYHFGLYQSSQFVIFCKNKNYLRPPFLTGARIRLYRATRPQNPQIWTM